MNRLVLLVCLACILINLSWSQSVPLRFNYQVSLRNNNGEPILDGKVSFRIRVLNSIPSGTIEYQEEHKSIQTISGIASLIIGNGVNISGSLSSIQDLSKSYYLKVEFDPNNTTSYSEISSTQLISVPYAITANTLSQNGAGKDQVLKWDGSKWSPSDDLNGGSGGSSNLSGDVTGITSSNIISKLQGKSIAASNPSSGQVLKFNGTTWVPDTDNTGSGSSTLFGDVTGSINNSKVVKLQGRDITSSNPSKDNILKWDGTKWELSTDQTGSGASPFTLGTSNTYYNNGNNKFVISNNNITNALSIKGNDNYPGLQVRYSDRFVILGVESSNNPFISLGHSNNDYAGIRRAPGTQKYETYCDGTKCFIMNHPSQLDKLIAYACIEGPEAAAYERGTIKLINGKAEVKFSEHFELVINPSTITVNLTPLSKSSKGLAVTSKNADGIIIEELNSGTGNYEIDWEVKAVRKGFEDFKVIREKSDYKSDRIVIND